MVVISFVILATVIALRTPAWESSDEPDHVQNIETLVSGRWYRMDPGSGLEAHQAPLYYLVWAGWQRIIGKPPIVPNPGRRTIPRTSRGVFLHHRESDHRFLLWLRLPNVLLGALTVLLTFFAIRMVTSDPWTPVVAASIVAAMPRFVFLSAFVTNDNLATFLGALLTLCALRYVVAPTTSRMVLVGAAVGLLIVTKLSALPLAAVLVVAVFARRRWLDRARVALIGCATALVVCGWYLVQNAVRYGDPLARRASARYLAPIGGLGTFFTAYKVPDPIAMIAVQVPGKIARTFWYSSEWNRFRWPWYASVPFWLALAGALVGLIGAHVAKRVLMTLAVLTLASLLAVWLAAFQTATYEARLAFTGLPALAGLAALGVQRCKLPVRFLLPAIGLIGLLIAIYNDVLAVDWT
jgi:4-amino-4-deoxy-L-arabinose transferase-like glycosyltransferase